MYDLEKILIKLGVEYKTTGVNVKKGNINIKCPYCLDDPSYHMGIDPDKGIYGCWRDNDHKGSNIVRLLKDASGKPYSAVKKLFPDNVFKFKKQEIKKQGQSTFFDGFDDRFRCIDPFSDLISQKQYIAYLKERFDFTESSQSKIGIADLCSTYDLRYSLNYPWKTRILFPVTYNWQYVSMTGRAIALNEPRHLHLSDADSIRSIKNCVYNYDNAMNAEYKDILLITEGTFDAINIDFVGRFTGQRAVALFNNAMTDKQLPLIVRLSSHFNKTFIMFDSDSYLKSLELSTHLEAFINDVSALACPLGFNDPGEMGKDDIIELLESL